MKINKEFILRQIAGDNIIVPTGKTVLEFNGVVSVNEVGASLWNMLQKEVTFEELAQGILNEYDVEESVAKQDIREFLDKLNENGILDKNEKSKEDE